MKIKDLIKQLKALKKAEGNIRVTSGTKNERGSEITTVIKRVLCPEDPYDHEIVIKITHH